MSELCHSRVVANSTQYIRHISTNEEKITWPNKVVTGCDALNETEFPLKFLQTSALLNSSDIPSGHLSEFTQLPLEFLKYIVVPAESFKLIFSQIFLVKMPQEGLRSAGQPHVQKALWAWPVALHSMSSPLSPSFPVYLTLIIKGRKKYLSKEKWFRGLGRNHQLSYRFETNHRTACVSHSVWLITSRDSDSWYCFQFVAKCGPDDTYCSRNYHRGGFEYFGRCLYVSLWTDFVQSRSKRRTSSKMGKGGQRSRSPGLATLLNTGPQYIHNVTRATIAV